MGQQRHKNPTILVAEDDPDDQEFLTEAFNTVTDSHHLKIVDSGKALLQFLESLEDSDLPCLIVLDYNMPELNGREILQILRLNRRYDPIPIVIFTTSGSAKAKADCLLFGAKDYLIKPASPAEIADRAKKMLNYCNN